MIVLEVIPTLESGGAQLSVLETVEAVTSAGGRAVVASAGGGMVPRVVAAGGTHIRLPLDTKNPVNIWANAARLGRLMKAERVALVHAHSRAPAWSALLAARRAGLPFVTTWHGTYGETLPLKRAYNSVMARGDRVLAVSRFIARSIAERHGLGSPRVVVVPPGVDVDRFDPEAIGAERIRKLGEQWNIPRDRPVVMLAARLVSWKGHEILLDALVRMQRSDVCCVFVGPLDGHERYVSRLRHFAGERRVTNRVRFVGGSDDMPTALMLADVVVNASTAPEAFGRIVIEAQAMARPVVATAHGGAMETIAPGATGWLVPPSDPDALAAALDRLFAMDREVQRTVGRAARAAILRSYSLSAMQRATVGIYRDLLRDSRSSRSAIAASPG